MVRQNQKFGQKQQLKLAPQQIQLLNLLHLNSFELEQRIQDETEDNPALELDSSPDEEPLIADHYDPEEESQSEKDFDSSDSYSQEDESYDHKSLDISSDVPSNPDWQLPLVQTKDFREQLHDQLSTFPLSSREQLLASYLVDSLEDDGYLRLNLADLADSLSFAQGIWVEESELLSALGILQSLEPAGIGARNLRECLLLQLRAKIPQTPQTDLAKQIVEDHLDDLALHHRDKIAGILKVTVQELSGAISLVERLTPRPSGGNTVELTKNRNIIPEFLIESGEQGDFRVSLIQTKSLHLRLNPVVTETWKALQFRPDLKKDKADAQYLKSKMDAATWFIDMIRQREDSMLNTMRAIVALQHDYFCSGDIKDLRPMVLKNVAEYTGLDISTISRVTSIKYALTDFGIIHLRTLFQQGMVRMDGELVTQREIADLLRELIANEDKQNPLTDQQLTLKLKEKGYPTARRTVAKYRDALHFPMAKLRKH